MKILTLLIIIGSVVAANYIVLAFVCYLLGKARGELKAMKGAGHGPH